mmetsp:Transcript_145806/g.254384  ORF Transcript_145806/g.254384 Transcript_145806/m.254384 type:complete len:195 (-) Transcript_145806:66-650(-)
MHKITFALALLAFVGHGRRVQIGNAPAESSSSEALDASNVLAKFLLANKPSAEFNPSHPGLSRPGRVSVHADLRPVAPLQHRVPAIRAAEPSGELAEMVKSADVVMFDLATCPFCRKTETALKEAGVDFKKVDIGDFKPALKDATGKTSAPSVWIKGTYVGGCNDGPEKWMGTLPMLKSGNFQAMIKGEWDPTS